MANIVAQLFRDHPDFDDFRTKVTALEGSFPFGHDDLIEIGEVYFERYPDCFSNRSCSDVTLGYKLTRLCIIEKMTEPMEGEIKVYFREMLYDLTRIEEAVGYVVKEKGVGAALESHADMTSRLKIIQNTIDSLPIGMVKERYIGGVSYIYNIMYLIKNAIGRAEARS